MEISWRHGGGCMEGLCMALWPKPPPQEGEPAGFVDMMCKDLLVNNFGMAYST